MGKITTLSSNLTKLRAALNMTQEQFAQKLKEDSDGIADISPLTISAYENGERIPPTINLYWMAKVFHVSIDELLGLSSANSIQNAYHDETSTEGDSNSPIIPDYGERIRIKDLIKYDRLPVYVKSSDKSFREGWAIVSYKNEKLIFADYMYPFSSQMEIYSYPPKNSEYISGRRLAPLTYKDCMNAKIMWVELLGADPYISGQYNGWYVHNENHTALINRTNGLTLPYMGIGVSFNAYLPKDQI